MSAVERFLPTRKFHIVPITEFAPDALKRSAKRAHRDRESLAHTTLLNLLAKSFGVSAGFSGFKDEYEKSLKIFMDRHGLKNHADLLTPRKEGALGNSLLKLSVEQVCGRFFDAGLSLPERLFTGYNYDYKSRYGDARYQFDQCVSSVFPGKVSHDHNGWLVLARKAELQPDFVVEPLGRRLIDCVVGGLLLEYVWPCFNLIGDLLIAPVSAPLTEPQMYWQSDVSLDHKSNELDLIRCLGKLFRMQLDSADEGWVEVIPYNNSLVFLKGDEGEYDFVIPGLRSKPFGHQIYAPYLKRADVPSQMNEDYHFRRWYYFGYQGWRELDEHRAEQDFYRKGGTPSSYPGALQVYRRYLGSQGKYLPGKARQSVGHSEIRFYPVRLDHKVLYVSDLVSIGELAIFSNRKPEYFEQRGAISEGQKPDQLASMNNDDPDLPASVTWYDACAYMADFESRHNLPVRLLKAGEYLAIRQQIDSGASQPERRFKEDGVIEFVDHTGQSYGAHPPYMEEESFQHLFCRYAKPLERITHASGLTFIDSDKFGEWLYENPYGHNAAAICSKSLCSIHGGEHLVRDLFPAHSTGKYKHVKIGFRLCYLAVEDQG